MRRRNLSVSLSKETLRNLDPERQLKEVAGGNFCTRLHCDSINLCTSDSCSTQPRCGL